MARAQTPTKLSLTRWAAIMQINPIHFEGVYVNTPTTCAQPWTQYGYQANDRVGREELAKAIAEAETDIETYLGFNLAPVWEVDEWVTTVRSARPELTNVTGRDLRGYAQPAQTKKGYLISGGIRSKEPIAAGAAVTYTDEDGDGYKETATITAATSLTNECDLTLYFPQDDPSVPEAAMDEWEIRDFRATIAGGTLTIKARREQFVLPNVQERFIIPSDDTHLRGVDGADDAKFITTVDVYRTYNDPQRQVQFLWEPTGCGECGGGGCAMCSYAVQFGCLSGRDNPRLGIVAYHPATWNADTLTFDSAGWAVGRQPDMVRLWYYSGYQEKGRGCLTRQMAPKFERIVAYYAAALLDRPVCSCNNVKAFIDQYQVDYAATVTEKGKRLNQSEFTNPFGTRYGQLYAWRRLRGMAIGKGA